MSWIFWVAVLWGLGIPKHRVTLKLQMWHKRTSTPILKWSCVVIDMASSFYNFDWIRLINSFHIWKVKACGVHYAYWRSLLRAPSLQVKAHMCLPRVGTRKQSSITISLLIIPSFVKLSILYVDICFCSKFNALTCGILCIVNV